MPEHSVATWSGLYAITPDIHDTAELVARVRLVLAAGSTWLQYRNKTADSALRREQSIALLPLCREHRVPLIINDDWQMAAELLADGVHLGQGDGAILQARTALGPSAIIGASCYDRFELAEAAARAGASYIAFGAFFPSFTKPHARRASLDLLTDAARLGLPRVAIGGITPQNAAPLVAAAADLVAAIDGVFAAADPAAAVRDYRACFE
jgi:thiamine-phosphate pyrophosphorylase